MELLQLQESEDKDSPLKNRIRKNYRHAKKWAKRTETNAFRVYDRDIKEYPLTIDYYDGRFLVQFFSDSREEEVQQILMDLFSITPDSIFWRERYKRTREEQYEKIGNTNESFIVLEYGVQFKVNLQDYLDTGLFLDHRETRQMVAKLAKGKRLLNLFAYTSSFSVHAAFRGAEFTKSVDLSNTYTEWSKENFLLNDLSLETNKVVRADVLRFLEEEEEKYDLIVIDPPTMSRSKKMNQMFDVQEDYTTLINRGLELLLPGGTLFFSTNLRSFKFEEELLNPCTVQEITHKTIPFDFHNKKIHRCFQIVE